MTQAQFIHQGQTVDYFPGADVAAGEVVVQGALVGVAKRDIKTGHHGALAVVGVFDFAKDSAEDISSGAALYWDDATDQATTTSTDNTLLGKAVAAAGVGTTVVRGRLSP